jgi:bifunctional DNase/RNase
MVINMRYLWRSGLIILVILIAAGCANKTVEEHVINAPTPMGELHEVMVKQVVMGYVDGGGVTPVVILTNKENDSQNLLIWVGMSEGRSIDMALNQQKPERPGTHDLFASVLGQFQMNMIRVVVTDLRAGTYFAIITMEVKGEVKEIDARPSDAIALALRSAAPIFVSEEVIRKGGWTKTQQPGVRERDEKPSESEESDNLL